MRLALLLVALGGLLPACAQVRSVSSGVASGASRAFGRVAAATRPPVASGPVVAVEPIYDAGWAGAGTAQPVASGAFLPPTE